DLPTLLLSFLLAVAVWISAVTAADPNETRQYPHPVIVEVLGLDPGLSLVGDIPETVNVTMTAPSSTWNTLLISPDIVKAFLDLSGKKAGDYEVKIKTQLGVRPVDIVLVDPASVSIHLENSSSVSMQIVLAAQGQPATGYNIGDPSFSESVANVNGPESLVAQIAQVVAPVKVEQAIQTLSQEVTLRAVDKEGNPIDNLSIAPVSVMVTLPIEPQGGYRNVAVKAIVSGQLEPGYRLSNISVLPPTVTVFSEDSQLVGQLPGYIETSVISIVAAKSDIDIGVSLKLPPGVTVVGDQTVTVHIGITPIENSVTIQNIKVEVVGLPDGMTATISPEYLSVIVSGPLNLLNQLTSTQVHVSVDLTGKQAGTYQLTPLANISISELRIESILPGTIEIIISPKQ
ncbi:MAG: CdaR family protein, partial [Anaerolineaceae bacterium]